MRQVKVIAWAALAALAVFSASATARRARQEPDPLCQMLFDEYVVGIGKINSSTRLAAGEIVAERGRNSGFWRDVLRELRKNDEQTETACVDILGKMLETDARARDFIQRTRETGEIFQWAPSILVGDEVVKELIARGEKADPFRADHYAIALARARVPQASELFRRWLVDASDERLADGDKFHAAVGLAELGDPAGVEWLIAHSSDPTPTVSNAWPGRVPSYNLDVCCVAALRELSGRKELRSRAEWEAWWKQADKATAARGHVALFDQ